MSEQTTVSDWIRRNIQRNIQTYTILIAMVLIWVIFAIMTKGGYLNAQNFSNLLRQMTVTSFLAAGMVFVIVTGGIDLSVGRLAGFVSVIAAVLQANFWPKVIGNNPILAAFLTVICGIAAGLAFGAIQAYVIAYLRVAPFIVTLGGMWVLNGGILLVTQGKTIPANQPGFSYIAQGYLPNWAGWVLAAVAIVFLIWNTIHDRGKKRKYGFELAPLYMDMIKVVIFSLLIAGYVFYVNLYNGVQVPVFLLAIAALVTSYVADNTRFGRYTYALGGNREAARLSGISIRSTLFQVFLLMGFMSGIAGIVLASYVGYGTIAAGNGYELDAIASCILGGTSPLGGSGTIIGAMIGSLIMSSLTNGLQFLNVAPAWQYVVKGVVLVVAVIADVYFRRNK